MKLLNRKLECRPNKKEAEVLLLGDLHLGYPTADTEKFVANIDWCIKKQIYVVGMGDYMESGMRDSVGDSVYKQELDPQKQLDEVVRIFTPLAEKGLLLGLLKGNHEARIEKATGIDVTKVMARMLGVPYLGDSIYCMFRVGKQNYKCFFTHGSTMSQLPHTKMKKVMDLGKFIRADLFGMGHTHGLTSYTQPIREFDLRYKIIRERKVYFVLTGGYLRYEGSYAEMKGYEPTKTGSPKVKLAGDRWDIHIGF